MSYQSTIERFFETLITGNRPAARQLVLSSFSAGLTAEDLITEVYWPTYEMIDKMFRSDQLSALSHHLATRLLRVLVDQTASKLTQRPTIGKRVLCFCGTTEADEMGAQMAADLLESSGYEVTFGGGGIASDEILGLVQETSPDVLLMFATSPGDLPGIREMIDRIREINAHPNMQIAVGAGVFSRADGLAEEIGADIWAHTPLEMVTALQEEPERRSAVSDRTIGKGRRRSKAA